MTGQPSVLVLTPTCNAEAFLRRTLDSLARYLCENHGELAERPEPAGAVPRQTEPAVRSGSVWPHAIARRRSCGR